MYTELYKTVITQKKCAAWRLANRHARARIAVGGTAGSGARVFSSTENSYGSMVRTVLGKKDGNGMQLWTMIRSDLYRYRGDTGIRALLAAYLQTPGFRYSFYLRKVAFYAERKRTFGLLPYLYNRVWLNHYRFRYGFEISPATEIGAGLYLGHFGGVVISPYAKIGANVNIAQGVTIGAASRGSRVGAPVLQDRVWVGANAIIVGKVVIGSDSLIAPGAYVNFDVPEGSVVLGNPGKVVSSAGSAGYVNHVVEVKSDGSVTGIARQ